MDVPLNGEGYDHSGGSIKCAQGWTARSMLSFGMSCAAFVLSLSLLLFVLTSESGHSTQNFNKVHPESSNADSLTHSGAICVSCETLTRDLVVDPHAHNLTVKLDNGVHMCCASTASHMSFVLETVVAKQQMKEMQERAANCASSRMQDTSPASAHVGMLPPDKGSKRIESNAHVFVTFDPTHLNTSIEHARYVRVVKSGLKIMFSGHYYVYSQVLYKSPNTENDTPPHTLYHGIHRLSPNSPKHSKTLTKVAHTLCTGCQRANDTAFSGGTFHLLADDLLSVCVSDEDFINYDTINTFLGVAMLAVN